MFAKYVFVRLLMDGCMLLWLQHEQRDAAYERDDDDEDKRCAF